MPDLKKMSYLLSRLLYSGFKLKKNNFQPIRNTRSPEYFYSSWHWIACLAIFFLLKSSPSQADDYQVKILAPKNIQVLLEHNLELISNKKAQSIPPDYLALLIKKTPLQIKKILSTQGYFNSKESIKKSIQNHLPLFIIHVQIGPQAIIHRVHLLILGNASKSKTDYIHSWPLHSGKPFTVNAWADAKSTLLSQIKEDYPLAKITHSLALVNPHNNTVDLSVTINSGPKVFLGALKIHGLKRYPDTIIKNIITIYPHEPYNRSVLDRFSEKLSETGYFDTATVRIGTPNNQNIVPVEVHVIEHPRKKINASIGYNSDIGPQFNINYLDLDLRHSTWQFNPSLNIARQLQNYNLNFLLPRAQPGLSYAITSAFSHSNIQNNDLKTLVLGGSRIQKNNGNEHILSLQLYFDRQSLPYSPILISKTLYLSYLIHIFRINNRLWPSRGYYISMGAGISQQGIISDQSFIREHIKGMWFIPFLTTNTLILRGEIGAIESRGSNGIPPTLLYITGGGQSVRGYAYNSLGINENGAIVGGKFLTIASAEADHWFTPKWAGAVFYDAGNASNRWHMPLKKGAGIGARWRSPVGAVSIDIAHGFESGSSYRFNLSVGYSF